MKNNIFKLLEYSYYFSLIILFILYLFPGSLIGYFLYGNLGQQPDLIPNPIGTSINHLISFICLSSLAFIMRVRERKFINSFQFLFLHTIAGIITILTPSDLYQRANLFLSVFIITSIYIVSYFSISIIANGDINDINLNIPLLFYRRSYR